MDEIAFEELSEYATAYAKAAGHVSLPLGKDKLPLFVKELFPQEFFPEHIMNSLIERNSNIVPFDFLAMIRALVSISKNIRVTPRQTVGVRKLKISEALQLSKLFIDMDQDKDGLVQSSHYAYANLDTSKLPPLSNFNDLVRSVASSYAPVELQSHALRTSASGDHLQQAFGAQPVFASFQQSAPIHQQQLGAMQLQQPVMPQYGNAQQQFQQQQNLQQQAQYQQYLQQQHNQGNPFLAPQPPQQQPQQQYYQQQAPPPPSQQPQHYYPQQQPFVSPQQPNNNPFSPQPPQQAYGPPHPSGISPRQNYSPAFPSPSPQSPMMPPPQQQPPPPPLQPLQPHQAPQQPPQQAFQQPQQPAQAIQPRAVSPPAGTTQLDTVTLLKLFNLADKDASGMLTADELVPIVRGVVRPGIPVTAQHSQMLMKMLDKDGSGAITIDEFLEGAKKFNWNADVLTDLVAKAQHQRPLSTSSSGTEDIEIAYTELAFGDKIGEGTFGLVYKGNWRGSPVAVKMLKMQNITDRALDEFRKELQILARLRHPNIVLLMGASTAPPNLTFVTEFLAGGSLFDKLQAKQITIDSLTFKRMAREIAQGMNYLHLKGIIHRDLKSLNILLDHNLTAKICDFGLSKMKSESADVMTKKVGTPIWMAPELIRGDDYNEKVDIYAYGIILWELGTGELPYPKMDSIQIAVAVSAKGLRPPIPDKWPPFLKELAQVCWHEDPKMRPSFTQILEKLNQWN